MGDLITTNRRRRVSTLSQSSQALPSVESSLDDFIARAHEAEPQTWDPTREATERADELLQAREAEVARLRDAEAQVRSQMDSERAALTQHIAALEQRLATSPDPTRSNDRIAEAELMALRSQVAAAEHRAVQAEQSMQPAVAVAAPRNSIPLWLIPAIVVIGLAGLFAGRMLARPTAAPSPTVTPIIEATPVRPANAPAPGAPEPTAAPAVAPANTATPPAPAPGPTTGVAAAPAPAPPAPASAQPDGAAPPAPEPSKTTQPARAKKTARPNNKPAAKSGGLVDPF